MSTLSLFLLLKLRAITTFINLLNKIKQVVFTLQIKGSYNDLPVLKIKREVMFTLQIKGSYNPGHERQTSKMHYFYPSNQMHLFPLFRLKDAKFLTYKVLRTGRRLCLRMSKTVHWGALMYFSHSYLHTFKNKE
jgi:hypothetical protein